MQPPLGKGSHVTSGPVTTVVQWSAAQVLTGCVYDHVMLPPISNAPLLGVMFTMID